MFVEDTSNDKQSRFAHRGVETRKSLDSKSDVLFLLKAIDAQDDLAPRPHGFSLHLVCARNVDAWVDDLQRPGREAREDPFDNASSEVAVDNDGMTRSGAPAFNAVERDSVRLLQDGNGTVAFLSKRLVGKVAVEQNADVGIQITKKRHTGAQLIDEEMSGFQVIELVAEDGN